VVGWGWEVKGEMNGQESLWHREGKIAASTRGARSKGPGYSQREIHLIQPLTVFTSKSKFMERKKAWLRFTRFTTPPPTTPAPHTAILNTRTMIQWRGVVGVG
jgi:hypothetical protein